MLCPKCGTLQPDTDAVCDVCGASLRAAQEARKPQPTGELAKILSAPESPAEAATEQQAPAPTTSAEAPAGTEQPAPGHWQAASLWARPSARPAAPVVPPNAADAAGSVGLPKVEGAHASKAVSAQARQYLEWPAVRLTDDEEQFRSEWAKTRGESSRRPPVAPKRYPFEGPLGSVMLASGILLAAAGVALKLLVGSRLVFVPAALLVLAGLIAVLIAIDNRAAVRLDEQGLWRDAPFTGERVFWPVVVSVAALYKPLPGPLAGLYGSICMRVKTRDGRSIDFKIPCFLGTPAIRNLAELKRQLAHVAAMFGARLL